MLTLTFSQALVAVLCITTNAVIWTWLVGDYRHVGTRNDLRSAEADLAHVQREFGAYCQVVERERAEQGERLAS